MSATSPIASVDGICEVRRFPGPGGTADAPERLLIEVPHGATEERHFDALRGRLAGDYAEDLKEFFFVNTDVGSFECALEVAGRVAERAAPVLVVRGLVPRTFVDLNRLVDCEQDRRMTPAFPEYVTHPDDIELLEELHRTYQAVARRAYERVCPASGLALILHTYAPKTVEIHRIDDRIVEALREAYAPESYARWVDRPAVDVISADHEGRCLAPEPFVAAIRNGYRAMGIEAAENATYRLHPGTLGHCHSVRYPGRVTCLELNRALLAEPFDPFREMRIGRENVRRMSAPIVAALLDELDPARAGGADSC